jgi:hypothetical protein
MIELSDWQRSNDEYLGVALAWLRARLERLAPSEPAGTSGGWHVVRDSGQGSIWDRLTGRRAKGPGEGTLVLPMPPLRALPKGEGEEPELAAAMARLEAAEPPPALVILANRLGLSTFEREVLLLATALELDTRMAGLCARAQDDPSRPGPTFALAMALFDSPSWDVLSPERPLRYWKLIEITQPAGQPLTASSIRADERVVNFVKGLNYLDDRLAPLLTPLPAGALRLDFPQSHATLVDSILEAMRRPSTGGRLPAIQLAGSDGATKQLLAAKVAEACGLRLYRLAAEGIPTSPAEVDALARLWDREGALLPLALYLDHPEGEGSTAEASTAAVDRFITRSRGVVFLAVREPRPARGEVPITIDVRRPTTAEQRAAWVAQLGDSRAELAARLAGQFDLSVPAIQDVVERLTPGEGGASAMEERDLWKGCLDLTRPRLDLLAQRIDPRATWDDLVLPPEVIGTLRQLVAQVAQRTRVYEDWGFGERMNRGMGISALFAGESGTGKSMAAEVVARELRLDLYRIDLSAVVSKYIGETEKNLRRVFDAAEEGGAILLFDEADALFGKRSEVKDSHDRYANIEINYLLQRLEAYRGLAILTTNLKSALDRAFLRRLRFVADFPFPGVPERKQMWQQAFPPTAEVQQLDFDRLARLSLTGGSIHNIALNAAFLAAHGDEQIGMGRVLEAARSEFRKLERPINEADFRWLGSAEGAVA